MILFLRQKFVTIFLLLILAWGGFGFLSNAAASSHVQITPNPTQQAIQQTNHPLSQGGSGLRIPTDTDVELSQDISRQPLGTLVASIINYFIGFLGLAATIVFVIGGMMWVLSGGSEDLINRGKKMMTYAALGILIIILSFSIVRFITRAGEGVAPGTAQNPPPVTPPASLTAAVVTTGSASRVNRNAATLNGTLDDLGRAASVNVSFEWGINTGYANTTPARTLRQTGPFTADLQNLQPDTTYHFRTKADVAGQPTQYGQDATFQTPAVPAPSAPSSAVTTATASNLHSRLATLNGTLDDLQGASAVNVSFEWGNSTSYGRETSPRTVRGTGPFTANITDLQPGTDYHFRAKAVISGQLPAYGSDGTFTTPQEPPPFQRPAGGQQGQQSQGGSGGSSGTGATSAGGNPPPITSGGGTSRNPGTISSAPGQAGVSQQSTPAFTEELSAIDGRLDGLEGNIQNLGQQVRNLPQASRVAIEQILDDIEAVSPLTGESERTLQSLDRGIEAAEQLLETTEDPALRDALTNAIQALRDFSFLRGQLDRLRDSMPESAATLELYEAASEALDQAIEDPDNPLKLRRFNDKFRELRDLVAAFPVVSVQILAVPIEGNVPLTVTFDGLNSRDPTGGTISEYKWSFLDNNGQEVSLGQDPVVVYTFEQANTYSVRLRASTSNVDRDGYKTAADGLAFIRIKAQPPATQVRIRIDGEPVTDVYHATVEQAQTGLSFDPSESTPALGRVIERYEWSFGDGATEIRATPTTVVHNYQRPGEYFVKLTTIDNQNERDSLTIKLFVKTVAADINIVPEEGNVNTDFRFEGVDSRSDEGIITSYQWVIYDAMRAVMKESDQQIFRHKFSQPGEYQVVLSVTDVAVQSDKVIKTVKVMSRAPVANFSWSVQRSNHPNRIAFDAIASYDLDEGDLVTYSWDFDGDGTFDLLDAPAATTEYSYNKVGEFKARLQVKDQFGQRGLAEKTVSVESILSGDIEASRRVANVGEEITFTAKSPGAVAYFWDFGDGETGTTEKTKISHTYAKQGKYTVRLVFFDKDDNENEAKIRVLIGQGDRPVAQADFTVNGHLVEPIEDLCGPDKPGIVVYRSDLVRFDARESINIDGSNRLLLYNWELGDGDKNNRKEFTHKYHELNATNQCNKATLVVKDQVSGKVSEDDVLYFQVMNRLPELTDFVIESSNTAKLVTPTKVLLRAVNPHDDDGNIKKYRWFYYREGQEDERLGVHNTNTPNTEIIVTASGEPEVAETYHFVLEIVDNDNGIFNTEERFRDLAVLKIINGPNLSPVAEFKTDKTTVSVGDSITFLSTSYDPQGDILPESAFRWDFDGDGEFDDTSSGPQVNRQFNTPGEYSVRLKVTHRGLSSSAMHPVFIQPTQDYPQAGFTYKISGNEVTFDASTSRFDEDLPDTTLRFEWDFDAAKDSNGNGINDDDVESTDLQATHAYDERITYRVRLKVKDAFGQEGVAVREVNLGLSEEERNRNTFRTLRIQSPENPLTTLEISVTPYYLQRGESTEITATIINADQSPYEGRIFFEVTEGSATIGPSPAKASQSKATAILTVPEKGLVKVRVKATGTTYGDLIEQVQFNVR